MANITLWAWTSEDNGSGIGTTYQMVAPADFKVIADPPEPSIGADANMRYWFDEPNDTWVLKPDALPGPMNGYPVDYWAWNGQPRYDVDPSDPLRNSWVLKPDAQPVEQPQE